MMLGNGEGHFCLPGLREVVKDDEIWGIPSLWLAAEVDGDWWHRRHWEIVGKYTERVNACAKQPTDC